MIIENEILFRAQLTHVLYISILCTDGAAFQSLH